MKFLPGLELNRRFFVGVVRPLLASAYPRLRYAAARIGEGSEVPGYDTPRSMDHDWGLQLTVYLGPQDLAALKRPLDQLLVHQLPVSFLGHSVNWSLPVAAPGIKIPSPVLRGPVNHRIHLTTVPAFFTQHLGINPCRRLSVTDWLLLPQQRLLGATSGAVYLDQLGDLEAVRRTLRWYPDAVWRYLLAAQWARIGQEGPFPGRAAEVGDELGSRLVTGRLVRDLMRLCFLMERRYAPYSKWLGTGFSRLRCGKTMGRMLLRTLRARAWRERERWSCRALVAAARMHNRLRLTPPIPARVSRFEGRPFLVIHGDRAEALVKTIRDPQVRRLPRFLGAVDQFADSTDLNDYPNRIPRLRPLYARAD